IQKGNFGELRNTVHVARALNLNSISFLAVDTTSNAFNRPGGWSPGHQATVALNTTEVAVLESEIEALISEYENEIESGFVVEDAEKLRRIPLRFRSRLGQIPAMAPRCNAPWVSAVVESDGTVRPCFFHRPIGNINGQSLSEALNSPRAVEFRESLHVAENPICRRCVCSLYSPQA